MNKLFKYNQISKIVYLLNKKLNCFHSLNLQHVLCKYIIQWEINI